MWGGVGALVAARRWGGASASDKAWRAATTAPTPPHILSRPYAHSSLIQKPTSESLWGQGGTGWFQDFLVFRITCSGPPCGQYRLNKDEASGKWFGKPL